MIHILYRHSNISTIFTFFITTFLSSPQQLPPQQQSSSSSSRAERFQTRHIGRVSLIVSFMMRFITKGRFLLTTCRFSFHPEVMSLYGPWRFDDAPLFPLKRYTQGIMPGYP
jgi:hypothetical protein